jgi:hypothetical protein
VRRLPPSTRNGEEKAGSGPKVIPLSLKLSPSLQFTIVVRVDSVQFLNPLLIICLEEEVHDGEWALCGSVRHSSSSSLIKNSGEKKGGGTFVQIAVTDSDGTQINTNDNIYVYVVVGGVWWYGKEEEAVWDQREEIKNTSTNKSQLILKDFPSLYSRPVTKNKRN